MKWQMLLLAAALSFNLGGCCSALKAAPNPVALAGIEQQSGDIVAAATNEEVGLLKTFDDLDFNVYSHEKWDEIGRSHADNIIVHYPDGSTTTGLRDHIAALKPQFSFAPDTKIKRHPIRIAQGNMTAVTGIFEGTFTKPLTLPNGTVIAPTNKAFKVEMITVGRWEQGKLVEEWLFWDNMLFMKQIGLAN